MKHISSILSFCLALNLLVATSGLPLVYRYCGSELHSITVAFTPADTTPQPLLEECSPSKTACCEADEEQEFTNDTTPCSPEHNEDVQTELAIDAGEHCAHYEAEDEQPACTADAPTLQARFTCPMFIMMETCRQEIHVEQLIVTVHQAESATTELFHGNPQLLFTIPHKPGLQSLSSPTALASGVIFSLPPPDIPVRICSLLI